MEVFSVEHIPNDCMHIYNIRFNSICLEYEIILL